MFIVPEHDFGKSSLKIFFFSKNRQNWHISIRDSGKIKGIKEEMRSKVASRGPKFKKRSLTKLLKWSKPSRNFHKKRKIGLFEKVTQKFSKNSQI